MSRNKIIKLRVSENEYDAIMNKITEAETTISDFIRYRILNYRLRKTTAERDKVRHIARIGANVNQIARWVNVNKRRAETIEVILHLDAISEQLKRLAEDECT